MDIQEMARVLNITEAEAKVLVENDKNVDRMKSSTEINNDLSTEQKKVSKGARKSERVYKFDTTKRKKKENPEKKMIVDTLQNSLREIGATDFEIINQEREFNFAVNGVKYRLTLAVPREKKGV